MSYRSSLSTAAVAIAALCLTVTADAQGADDMSSSDLSVPDFFGLGFGALPVTLGSDQYFAGAAPAGRISDGNRFITLSGNYVNVNVLEHPNLRFGPAGRLRFGRDPDRIDDQAVASLPAIDNTLELGAFVTWSDLNGRDLRDRYQIGIDVTADVLGEHDGVVGSLYARQFFGIGDFALGGVAIATSYGSSNYMNTFFEVGGGEVLPEYEPGAGFRDVRLQAGIVQPLSKQWAIGAGFQYLRLIDVAADSPIVSDRGDENQWLVGFGLVRIFGLD